MSSLNPTTKIGRQIGEGLRIHTGASDDEARKRALEVLEMVEMPRPAERLEQYPFELSGGLRQRVIIAMGLVFVLLAVRLFRSHAGEVGKQRKDDGLYDVRAGAKDARNLFAFSILYLTLLFATLLVEHLMRIKPLELS